MRGAAGTGCGNGGAGTGCAHVDIDTGCGDGVWGRGAHVRDLGGGGAHVVDRQLGGGCEATDLGRLVISEDETLDEDRELRHDLLGVRVRGRGRGKG